MGYGHHGDSASSSLSLKQRIRSSSCFSCCFRGCGGAVDSSPDDERHLASLVRCPAAWLRSKAQELPELRERCRGLVSRMGRHHRRHCSGDFGYDPLSYALNFDEGGSDFEGDGGEVSPVEYRYRNFSSRLPPTPPHPVAAAAGKELACS